MGRVRAANMACAAALAIRRGGRILGRMGASLYDTDILAWSVAQADRLRRLAAGERVNDLDWEHMIEEVEALGRSEVRAVHSLLDQALLHALNIRAFPDHPAQRHWRQALFVFLDQARDGYQPSRAQRFDLAALYERARRRVLFDLVEIGEPRPIPPGIALTITELMAPGFEAAELLAVIAAP